MSNSNGTETAAYAERLKSVDALWKRVLGVQRIYTWNLRRLEPGFMLEVGCGVGRNLHAVKGNAVGVDHNPHSVAHATANGFRAFTVEQFEGSEYARPGRFDSLLVSHVLEHLNEAEAKSLLVQYLPYVRAGGRVISITPQERGYASDHTHQRFMGFDEVQQLFASAGLHQESHHSFPFPRLLGRAFTYNEFVVTARKP